MTEVGPEIPFEPGRPTVALLNANPFAEGIANLGGQVIAKALLDAEMNVDFGFADTTTVHRPLLGGTSPADCDVVAISVPFEDTYHHVPRLIRCCGISARAKDRADRDPIVVAGGMALINPMPLAPFFDVVILGEGRETFVEVVRTVEVGRRAGRRRAEILRTIAQQAHVYVPSLYKIGYDSLGSVTEFVALDGAPARIVPARPLDMAEHPITSIWTSPRACYKYDDYFSVMVAMGCHLKCPFCVVGLVQGAENGRALNVTQEKVIQLSKERRERHGTNLIKLFFASSFSGHAEIEPLNLKNLLEAMIELGFECRVGSLNVRQADDELLTLVKRAGQERVTFAPETSESLRPSVGKVYSKDDKLVSIAERAGALGVGLDLYTMLGLPEERPSHLRELAQLIERCRRALGSSQSLEISINPAFAKAQTPYERYATVRPEVARGRFAFLRSCLSSEEGIEWVTVLDDPMCYYQPILALGGEELAPVLEAVSDNFAPTEDEWRAAVWEHVGDDQRYFRPRGDGEALPWQHIVFNEHGKMLVKLKTFTRIAQRG